MATSNKAQDPAAAALSAIEEALNLGEGSVEEPKGPEISPLLYPKAPDTDKGLRAPNAAGAEADRSGLRLPEVEDLPLFAPKRPGKAGELGVGSGGPSIPPANDDRDSVGAMLRALNRKPSGTPFVLAALFSGVWIALAVAYFATRRAEFVGHGALLERPDLPLYALAVVGPVIFFVITALLARRAQEMRLTARSMVEIAVRLAEPEAMASEQMVTLSQAVRREIVSMGDGIERALARAGELETLVRSEVSNLERSYSDNERRIRALVDELSSEREAIQVNSERMRNAIGGAHDAFSHELETAASGLTENLNAAGNRITMSLGAKAEEIRFALSQAGDHLVENLASQVEEVVGRLERAKESIEVTVGQASEEISQGLAQRFGEVASQSAKINERLELNAQESLDTFTYHANTLGDRFTETVNDAISAIATHSERVSETLGDRLQQFEQTMVSHGDTIADRLGDDAQQLSSLLAKQLESIESVISVQGGDLDSKLELRTQQTADVFVAQTQAFEDRASNKLQELAESLDALIQRVDSGLEGRAKALNEMLAARTLDVAKVLGEGGREVTHALEARANEIDEILASRATLITDTFSAKADEVNAVLGGRAAEIADTLDERIDRFEERVVNRLDTVSADLGNRGRDLTDNLAARAREIDESLTHHTNNIGVALDHESGELASLLSGRAETLKSLLAQASGDLDSTLAQRIGEIGGVLADRVTEIGTTLASRLTELQTTLEQSSVNFNEALVSNATASVDALVATNEKLKGETGATIGALAERNAALQEMIGSADASFASIETALAARIQQFEQAVTGVTKEIEDLGANAGTTIGSARALYETIAHQQQSLALAAADLSRSQVELDRSLTERRTALESLLDSVQSQREEFDNLMSSFSALVDESFQRVEGRAREIGTFLADTSQVTAGMVERQFGDIRSSLGTERERTAALLRATYEQANAEVEGILGQSTVRFQSAATEMRGLAHEIQRELEATREELRRNAVILPQETAEQTAAMRRVVGDQIKALNELTDIVARSGHSFDLSDPLAFGAGRPEGPLVRRLEAGRPEREPALAEAMRSEPPLPSPRAASAPRPSSLHDRGPGWLSDLLARASREESQPAKPLPRGPQQSEPLEAISHDIARMVDHAAIGEAWDNYRRGETNAFSRQLYIGRGPQTFEEIRRRYRSDVEFRETVDRYVLEFERLLSDVSRNDRDDTLTRTYLTSETGKVYTMLAHAAGRLGS